MCIRAHSFWATHKHHQLDFSVGRQQWFQRSPTAEHFIIEAVGLQALWGEGKNTLTMFYHDGHIYFA